MRSFVSDSVLQKYDLNFTISIRGSFKDEQEKKSHHLKHWQMLQRSEVSYVMRIKGTLEGKSLKCLVI